MTGFTHIIISRFNLLKDTRITINQNFIQCEEIKDGFNVYAGERDIYVQLAFNKRWEPLFYNIVGVPIPVTKYCYSTSPNFQTYLLKVEEYIISKYDIIKSDAYSLLP